MFSMFLTKTKKSVVTLSSEARSCRMSPTIKDVLLELSMENCRFNIVASKTKANKFLNPCTDE